MEYFAARNGHINLDGIKIDFKKMREFFLDVYMYFDRQKYFKKAFEGWYKHEPPLMSPSPSAFFFQHLPNRDIYPIEEYNHKFDEVTLFTVIEILHDYIRVPDDIFDDVEAARKEFRDEINKYLRCYKDGYLLSDKGYIINLPEDGMGKLISGDLPEKTDETTTDKVETAIKMFFRFDSNIELKRKAIAILADILEPYRKDLYAQTTEKHDKLIFDIVNNYGIRHNNLQQKEDYTKPVWYEWMFHYYLATVHAALRLNLKKR